jgi:hypothetical protein
MTPQTTMLEQQPGQLGAENEETRSGFVDTLEAMEYGLKDAVTAAGDAVNETMEATREGVRGAADAFAWALDVPGHVSRHPWVALGAVILGGLLLVRFCRRQ